MLHFFKQRRAIVFGLVCLSLCCLFVNLYLINTARNPWLATSRFNGSRSLYWMTGRFSPGATRSMEDSCQSLKNLVFLRTHKTASSTLAVLLYRFGYNNQLSFLFTHDQSYGHFRQVPITLKSLPGMYPPIGVRQGDYENYKFNISAGHVIYRNRSIFDALMYGRPGYITIIREPVQQFTSYFHYFNFKGKFMKNKRLSSKDQYAHMTEFLSHSSKYATAKGHSNVYIADRNPQSFDLGLPLQEMDNQIYISDFISRIEADLDLVLITEYFDESLILLKRQFCWSMYDVLYFKRNVRHFEPTETPRNLIRRYVSGTMLTYCCMIISIEPCGGKYSLMEKVLKEISRNSKHA
ncbi:galactosylceramide sulfotransferase-like [Ptychodera flava]|uniref:galactosylceramide sulfotransferase-like n=1 Tax=Ptychodera flava TaxID=63121 RepID=UPI003969F8E4